MTAVNPPRALITGAAQRIGAAIAQHLHAQGYDLLLHYRQSLDAAQALATQLNHTRAQSCRLVQADLSQHAEVLQLVKEVKAQGDLNLLVNNAASFYPTPLAEANENAWQELFDTNLKSAFFLCQGLRESLSTREGAIINIIDIHAQRGLLHYPIYSMTKAAMQMLTLSLAKELAPQVRVNGVSPGAILWPEADASLSAEAKQAILDKVLLGRCGRPEDIAEAVGFLAKAGYITGQILAVDGGRSLYS
ncbi:pteridine reductase [Nitrincola tapanii]|uniref:Pteridine reductase n=1 Tax=Nitrincola tapanii TaxID=1708751 RepID=A0A5A9VYD8_9GAMM|nr:pteridine reductase [Nitrincola tapanii]KAA0873557.1 pteridine reductase [Nitrincola tapanii]